MMLYGLTRFLINQTDLVTPLSFLHQHCMDPREENVILESDTSPNTICISIPWRLRDFTKHK